jgi:hypothetical protein
VLGIPGTPFYKPQVSRHGDKKWQGNPGEINLFTVEFRSHGGKMHFQSSLIKNNWNSRHPLLQTTFFQGFWQKITWKIRGVGDFTPCVLNRGCTDKTCNKSFAMANCILHFIHPCFPPPC